MPETVVIRARRETRDLLHDIARSEGTTAIDTLQRLVSDAAEARLLSAVATDLSAAPEPSERAAWDVALADGLDPDEDFSSWR